MDENRPDLPELESVRTSNGQYLPILILFGALNSQIIYAIIRGYFKYEQYLDTKEKLIVALIPACVIYIIVRILSGFHSYATDRNGITMRGVLRRRFIPWMDIKAASTAQTRIGSIVLILETNNGTVRIDPRGFGSSTWNADSIVASTWQHLRRFGRARDIKLSENALKLWEPIPDSVPEEMTWGHPPSRKTKAGAVAGTAFFILPIIGIWVSPDMSTHTLLFSITLTILSAVLVRLIYVQTMLRAHLVHVKRDGLQAELVSLSVYIPWPDVTSAQWYTTGSDAHLVIRSSAPKREVYIPFTSGDAESERLIMSIFRYLRKTGMKQAIVMPEMYSMNPDALTRTENSNGRTIEFTYIIMLPEPARTHVRRLLNLSLVMMFTGAIIIFVFVVLGGLERISAYLFALPHDNFFMNGNMILPSFCLMFGGIAFSAYLSGWLVSRMTGAYKSEWREFLKVGAPKKFARIFIRFMVAIGILGVLVSPLYMNRYIRISDAGITVNPLLEFKERSYTWNQIKSIESRIHRYINRGEPAARYTYTIRFSDGKQWQFNDNETVTRRQAELRQAAEFIALRIGKLMKYVDDEE
ncbi:MAG: PH domain-containing protein [Armatimonadota bacterium]